MKELRQKLRHELITETGSEEEKVECLESSLNSMEIQLEAVETLLFVADAEAFATGHLRLLVLDGQGDIVRHSRVAVEDAWIAANYWVAKKFRDSYWWRDKREDLGYAKARLGSELGEKYKTDGEVGLFLRGTD